MLGSLRAMVENVEHELNKDSLDEATAVIGQLHRGYALPGKPTLMHPADLSELINDHMVSQHYTDTDFTSVHPLVSIRGITYKQSIHMPQITTKFR